MAGDGAAVDHESEFGELIGDALGGPPMSSRRDDSIFSMTQAGVAFGLRCGLDERSHSPASP